MPVYSEGHVNLLHLISERGAEMIQNPKTQIAVGSALSATPFWLTAFQNVSIVAGAIATVCGAVIGLHGVWALIRKWRQK